jgi:hypothetical protein
VNICEKHNCEKLKKKGSVLVCEECLKESCRRYKCSEKGREANKRWNDSEKGKECRSRYEVSVKGKAAILRYHRTKKAKELSRLNKKLHSDKIVARNAVNHALRDDRLIKSDICEICGQSPTESHHWSYVKEHWLDVQWLCIKCHKQLHFQQKNKN